MKHVLVFSHSQDILDKLRKSCQILTQVGGSYGLMYVRPSCIYRCDHVLEINDPQLFENIAQLHKQYPISSLLSFHESYHELAAQLSEYLGLPFTYSAATIKTINNKIRFKQFLAGEGLDFSRCALVKDLTDIQRFGREYGYPIILKPVDGFASLGVSVIHGPNDIKQAMDWSKDISAQTQMMVEEFLPGKEFSVEIFSENGIHNLICITEKFKETKHFVGLGHRIPAQLSNFHQQLIIDRVETMLSKVGINNGPSHTEILLNGSDVHFVETHARIPGANITGIVKKLYKIDMLEAWIKQSLGKKQMPLKHSGTTRNFATIWFSYPKFSGILSEIIGVEQMQALEENIEIGLIKKAGDQVHYPLRGSTDRAAYALVVNADAERSQAIAQRAAEGLEYILEPPVI